MTIQEKLNEKNMSIYRLAKASQVPYATVNDICNGKARLEKCSAETVFKIAQALDISMDELLAPCILKRANFENFKSSVCHRVKESGDIDFVLGVLESNEIRKYYNRKWFAECLYLLAMVDYLCRENHIPLDEEYDDLRCLRLETPIYPASIIALSVGTNNDAPRKAAEEASIPEFKRFNIMESDIKNLA